MNDITTQYGVHKLSTELRISQGPKLLQPTGFRTVGSWAEPCNLSLQGLEFCSRQEVLVKCGLECLHPRKANPQTG